MGVIHKPAGDGKIFLLPEMTDDVRAAIERIPLKEASRQLARDAQKSLDDELQQAVEAYLGEPIGDPEALRGRLAHMEHEGGTSYFMDGKRILWVGPIETRREGDMLHAERKVQHFAPDAP